MTTIPRELVRQVVEACGGTWDEAQAEQVIAAAAAAYGGRWVLELRAPALMRTTNSARRLYWSVTSAERGRWREVTQAEARRAKLPTGLSRVRIHIEARFPDRTPRDASNLHDQLGKAIADALGPAKTVRDNKSPTGWRVEPGHGLVADDDQAHVEGPLITIGAPVDRRRFPYGQAVVTITELTGGADG